MKKKIDILGVKLDNYTVREAIMQVEGYLETNMLHTVESITMQLLMQSEQDDVLKKVVDSLDLAVIAEKEILQAVEIHTFQRIKETEGNDFFFEFFRLMQRRERGVFILGELKKKVEEMKERLIQEFPHLIFVGEYALEECVGDFEAVINDMNATTPSVILSILPTPMQEHFLSEHGEKMNAIIWYGIGSAKIEAPKSGILGAVKSALHKGRLKSSMSKYQERSAAKEEGK
ncbi:MAG: WecB/TagA/CpsF family glycosyltransferase [Clostridiales bacterium]|nr:WecB/TagA/CpsF family glycosyltransferase [Clostridiales bacterium]